MADKKTTLKVFGMQNVKTPDYTGLEVLQQDNALTISGDGQFTGSLLGTPVFADLELYIEDGDRLYLQDILITINQSKNIVTTQINDRKGTVKEYISEGDYNVQIQGLIVSDDYSYPRADVETLRELLTADVALKVISPFLEIWGIYELVVTDFNIPQQPGMQNTQAFSITALSDEPIELIIDA